MVETGTWSRDGFTRWRKSQKPSDDEGQKPSHDEGQKQETKDMANHEATEEQEQYSDEEIPAEIQSAVAQSHEVHGFAYRQPESEIKRAVHRDVYRIVKAADMYRWFRLDMGAPGDATESAISTITQEFYGPKSIEKYGFKCTIRRETHVIPNGDGGTREVRYLHMMKIDDRTTR